jgi:hypothetical protein
MQLISCGLSKPGQYYSGLNDAIHRLGSWWRCLESVWLVFTRHDSSYVLDTLIDYVSESDKIVVLELQGYWASYNLPEQCYRWLLDEGQSVEALDEWLVKREGLMPGGKSLRVHCNRCGHETRHVKRASHSHVVEDFMEEIDNFVNEHQIIDVLECLGCEDLVVRTTLKHDYYGESILFYPPPISRATPRWEGVLPVTIRAVLKEVYKALHADSPRLATMGARTIVDLVLVDKVGDIGTFRQKLEELEAKGFVGGKNREFLAAALEAGSAAAHRALDPGVRNLNHVMDIVENLLEAVYVLEEAAATLRKTTPPRQRSSEP